MEFISNTIEFLIASALLLLMWLTYLWGNNRVSMMTMPAVEEILGALLSIGLLGTLGIILYFFSLVLAKGIITVLLLTTLVYLVRKSLRAMSTHYSS